VKLKSKIEEGGFEPVRGHATDAGLDLRSPVDVWVHPGEHVMIDTKTAVMIPDGFVGLLTSQSSLMAHGLTSRGTIDAGYNASIKAVLYNHGKEGYLVHAGDKVTQLIILPIVIPDVEYVDDLGNSERGGGSFGSTGK
jgi:dUTP pyrophosphatase